MTKFSYSLYLAKQFGGTWRQDSENQGFWATLPTAKVAKLQPFLERYCVPHTIAHQGAEARVTVTGSLGTLTDLLHNLEEENGKPVIDQIYGKSPKALFR